MVITLNDGTQFHILLLVNYLCLVNRAFIITGRKNASLQDIKTLSLDYWLRASVANNRDTSQATKNVIIQICNTGLFQTNPNLICPQTNKTCHGIELVTVIKKLSP